MGPGCNPWQTCKKGWAKCGYCKNDKCKNKDDCDGDAFCYSSSNACRNCDGPATNDPEGENGCSAPIVGGDPCILADCNFDENGCNAHDHCYRDCGANKNKCDNNLGNDLLNYCRAKYSGIIELDCKHKAIGYKLAVKLLGGGAFLKGQRADCCK